MKHELIIPISMRPGFQSGCTCGYRTTTYRSTGRAENRAGRHIQMTVNPPPRKPYERPAIDIDTAAASFLSLLLWGLDESVPASRGGWPQ